MVARRFLLALAGAALALLGSLALATSVGAADLAPGEVLLHILSLMGFPVASGLSDAEARIVTNLRLPRVIVAAAAGGALALAATLQQASLRTRLAEPATTGASAGALLGASVALVGGLGAAHLEGTADTAALLVRASLASVGALVATLLVLRLARGAARLASGPLLLAGLAINALVGAIAAALLFLGPIGAQTGATVALSWILGGLLPQATATLAILISVIVLFTLAAALPLSRGLDQLVLGDDQAATAGVDVPRTRLIVLVVASIATGAAVAATGVLAFMGLLIPPVARRLAGPHHLHRSPLAFLLGAAALPLVDAASRVLAAPAELPAGILAALLGAPLLMFYLARDMRRAEV